MAVKLSYLDRSEVSHVIEMLSVPLMTAFMLQLASITFGSHFTWERGSK